MAGSLRHVEKAERFRTTALRLAAMLSCLLFLPRSSRFGFRALDNAVSEMGIFKAAEIQDKSESVSNRKRVRILLVWCGKKDLNLHELNVH